MNLALHTSPLSSSTGLPYAQQTQQSDDLSDAILQPIKLVSFKRNEQLLFRSYGLWRIHAGYVRTLSWTEEGEPVPLGFWGKDDVIGAAIAQAYPYEAKCLSTVKAEYLGAAYPFSREMALAQVRQSNDLLKIAHCRQAEPRLLRFICWLARHFGHPTGEGQLIKIRLTHQEISEAIGITRVTVSRLLKSLEREDKIRWTPYEKMVYQETFECFGDYIYSRERTA